VKVTLVPSSVSSGDWGRGHPLTSYVIDETVALDAGGLGLIGDATVQTAITDIILSHSHIDHVASLPILLDNTAGLRSKGVRIHASQATLDVLRTDLLNDRLWPDFINLSLGGVPFLRLERLEPGKTVEVRGLRVTPVEVDHTVPTLGFLVRCGGSSALFPSDTAPTEAIWRLANAAEDLKAVFLEAAFPDEMGALANVSKHLTPALFAAEMRKLTKPVPFIAVHIKPRFYDQVTSQLSALGLPNVQIGRPGASYEF
jgi:cAMP phosphodiesterase